MAKPKFYLETRRDKKTGEFLTGKMPINLFYSFNGQRLQYFTGIRLEEKYFRSECNSSDTIKPIKTSAPYAAQYNILLKDMAAKVVTIVTEAKGNDLNVKYAREQLDLIYKPKIEPEPAPVFEHNFISFFEQMIEEMKTGKRIITTGKLQGARYSIGTIKNYNSTLSLIKRYLIYDGKRILPFEAVDKGFYNGFKAYCFEEEDKEISSFSSYIKVVKTIMAEAAPASFKAKDFIKPGYESDNIFLNPKQIDQIANLDLSDATKYFEYSKGDELIKVGYGLLDRVRDLFLIGCFSGLRFGNYSKLELSSIEGNFIKLKQVKTGERIAIPIMSKLRPVLSKYPDGFPTISNQKFNELVKHVAQLAGLTALTEIKSFRGGKESRDKYPLYTLISSHTARRSYATNMFKAGVPPMLIMSATGHKRIETFLIYVKATNEDKAILMGEAMEKLGL